MLPFRFGNWDVAHGPINGGFAYMLVFRPVAAFGAVVGKLAVGGVLLVERSPILSCVLG
jgi:thiosulfate dehydrogenase [quinone] large subunit